MPQTTTLLAPKYHSSCPRHHCIYNKYHCIGPLYNCICPKIPQCLLKISLYLPPKYPFICPNTTVFAPNTTVSNRYTRLENLSWSHSDFIKFSLFFKEKVELWSIFYCLGLKGILGEQLKITMYVLPNTKQSVCLMSSHFFKNIA